MYYPKNPAVPMRILASSFKISKIKQIYVGGKKVIYEEKNPSAPAPLPVIDHQVLLW